MHLRVKENENFQIYLTLKYFLYHNMRRSGKILILN